MYEEWKGFKAGKWQASIDVRDFIQTNYTPYDGGESFLRGATARTEGLMKKVSRLFELEREFGGVLDIDTQTVTSLTRQSFGDNRRPPDGQAAAPRGESVRRHSDDAQGVRGLRLHALR